jgi:hypothetical protein
MELHMRSHHFTHRRPDWRAAIMAGVVFLVLELVLATLIPGGSPWASPRMIASTLLGRSVLHAPGTFEASIMVAALVLHFVLAIVFALILSLIMAPFRFDSSTAMASLVGAVFGLAMYLLNFYGMTRLFPWFAEARNWISVVSHLVFGVVVADTYLRLERKDAHSGDARFTGTFCPHAKGQLKCARGNHSSAADQLYPLVI